MFRDVTQFKKIYIACGRTDLRYGVDGLADLVQTTFKLDPFDEGTLFLFCGTKSDRIKGLLWEGDGFLLLYKRLSNGRYQWPRNTNELKEMSSEQYQWLMRLNSSRFLVLVPEIPSSAKIPASTQSGCPCM